MRFICYVRLRADVDLARAQIVHGEILVVQDRFVLIEDRC